MCPPGGSLAGDSSPKEDDLHEEAKEQKLPFCSIQ